MKRREELLLGFVLIMLIAIAHGADKADPTGTWKLTLIGKGNRFETSDLLKLKLEGNKLTGVFVDDETKKETTIDDGTFKDGEAVFSTTRELGRKDGKTKVTTKWKGKLDGNKIAFKADTEVNGQIRSRDVEAIRENP